MDESGCLNCESQMPPRILERSVQSLGEDRISKLHDSLLSHILSFVSTKNAVRTSTLSKRWKNVWKSIPKLQLDSRKFAYEDEFVDFMDRAFAVHSGLCLQTFKLKYDFEDLDESKFEQWFGNLVDCKVEHIDVVNCLTDRISIPGSICNCNTLVILELHNVRLEVPEMVSLPCLKILNFCKVGFWNASYFKVFISGCPVLEEVFIMRNYWDNMDIFHLSSRSLKKLCVFNTDVRLSTDLIVAIEAPNLEYLCLLGQSFEILATNISAYSLVEADLDVFMTVGATPVELQSKAANLCAAISAAKSLTFSSATLNSFVDIDLQPAFANLTYLDVEFPGTAWHLLSAFLANSPKLKTLIIGGLSTLLGRYKLVLPNNPQCLSTSLQYIELRGSVMGRPIELKLLNYFLRNSRLLKKAIICVHRDFQIQRKRLSLFLSKIRGLRNRYHSMCRIVAVRDRKRVVSPKYKKGKFSVRH